MPDRKLKVFLSSTAKDLTAFRKAVHARLVAMATADIRSLHSEIIWLLEQAANAHDTTQAEPPKADSERPTARPVARDGLGRTRRDARTVARG